MVSPNALTPVESHYSYPFLNATRRKVLQNNNMIFTTPDQFSFAGAASSGGGVVPPGGMPSMKGGPMMGPPGQIGKGPQLPPGAIPFPTAPKGGGIMQKLGKNKILVVGVVGLVIALAIFFMMRKGKRGRKR